MDPTRKTNGVRRMIETLRSVMVFDTLELDRVKRRLRRAASIADLRTIARRRLPRGVFDYIDGGVEDERTMQANYEAYAKVTFAPRVLRDMSHVDPSTTLLGDPLPIPLVLAPTGFTRIAHPQGEIAVARSAARAACRTACRACRPGRLSRSRPPVPANAGSRSTCGVTVDSSEN